MEVWNYVCGKRVEAGASYQYVLGQGLPSSDPPNRNWPSASEKWVQLTDLLDRYEWVGPVRASLS